jgi:hypothetical protein
VPALVAAFTAAALAGFGPPAGDAPAHLYRTELVRDGILVWDNLWYGGHYPLASYSVLYYLAAAVAGNVAVVVAASIAAAALFASVATREWGEAARWPSLAFAVLVCGPLLTGTYSYAVGITLGLGSIRLLQARRPALAVALAGLALLVAPLSFLVLCLALAAIALTRRPPLRATVGVGAGLAALAVLELGILSAFPTDGRYGFRGKELALLLISLVPATALSVRVPATRVLGAFFALWTAAAVVSYLVDSPFGSTITRPRFLAFALVLVPAILARFRPRLLAVVATLLALAYSTTPYKYVAPTVRDPRPASAEFWRPALDFLRTRVTPNERVDVVPTFDNWEAYHVPREGLALARGWYRQLDLARNPVLYERDLSAAEYRAWLRSRAVRFVLLPHVVLDRLASAAQARVLRSGRSGLTVRFRSADWTIYELPRATPILTGPAAAGLTTLDHTNIAGRVGAPGTYVLRVRWTPYWEVREGALCVEEGSRGTTRLRVRRAGRFALEVGGAGTVLRRALSRPATACRARATVATLPVSRKPGAAA